MKKQMNDAASHTGVLQNPFNPTKLTLWLQVAFAAGLLLAAGPAQAFNLLLNKNPGFEADGYDHTIPTGWTRYAPLTFAIYQPFGNYWNEVSSIMNGNAIAAHSGNCFWKEWGAAYDGTNNVAGIYQTFSSAPGSTYQASGWFYMNSSDAASSPTTIIWLQVEFIDSSSNLLALYKSANFNNSAGFNTWLQYQVTNACDLTQPVSTGDPYFPNTYAITGAVSQLVAPAGTASVVYRYCYLQSTNDGGSAYFDDADLEQLTGPIPPQISNIDPQKEIFVPPGNGLSFNVSSPSGFTINNSGIQVMLNNSNVSAGLVISGSSSNKTVTYNGLQSNTVYTVSIAATDSFNLMASANTSFQTTWAGLPAYSVPYTYLWEAEDWDFSGGMYVDNPVLCNTPELTAPTNCYFGVTGNHGQIAGAPLDEYPTSSQPPTYTLYRPIDEVGTSLSGDYSRPNLFAADRSDYDVNPFVGTAGFGGGCTWLNYTRDWPANSTNWIIGRFANGASSVGSIQMSLVTPTTTNILGTFTMNPYPASDPSYTSFQFVYLQNTNGNGQNANVVLNGTETLRTTSGGNLLPTFYMLVPAIPDLPYLSNLVPKPIDPTTGIRPFETTNALSFTVTATGATFPASGFQLILDGNDVSSGLVITGSASSNHVSYPYLPTNEMHSAIINVTNSLGHSISVSSQFDTFTQSNRMFEAEDFDYNGGQYISFENYTPDCYLGFTSVTNIDFYHTFSGETSVNFPYRPIGIPQQVALDFLRANYIANFASDYQLIYYAAGDWANYTRDYPTGSFNIYVRSSGNVGLTYTMTLGQVVSGQGTTNQVVKPIGQWSTVGTGINTFSWLPLTDAGGVAPVIVKLGGVSTLQVGTPTGNCFPNYFMLVPASAINLSAARSGNNVNLSFPTQTGGNYRVFYRTSLTTGNWTLLTSVLGNGTVETATDSNSADSQRFYKVTSP